MKKIYFLITLLIFFGICNALPFFEFFDNGIPDDWTQIQYNNTDGEWNWTFSGSFFMGADGNYVRANSENFATQVFDVGLFTPALDCTDLTFVSVDFARNFQVTSFIGEASLRVFSGGTAQENFEEELWFQDTSDSFFGGQASFTFNPINYANPSEVYIEFRYSTEGEVSAKFFKLDALIIYDSNPGPATVFFSEYIEGSGNNKALEIYNGSGDTVELDNYRINQASNGGGWEFQHYFPNGIILDAGETWVITTDEADEALLSSANEILSYPSVVHFTGNDARSLEHLTENDTWELLDVIGIPNENPGGGWDVAGIPEATSGHTLVRKPQTLCGNSDWIEAASTEERFSEWIVLPENTFDYIGSFPNFIDDYWAPAYPEYTLIGENNLFLEWQAPIPLENGWLYYHDDSIENGVSNGNAESGLAVNFQPVTYPCNIEQVRFFCDGASASSQEMNVWIIADDYSTVIGGPYLIDVIAEAWNTIDIDDIEIESGSFLVYTAAVEAVGPYIGRDDNTWEYGRTLWGNHFTGFTDVSAWGMNYTAITEAYVSYESNTLQALKPAKADIRNITNIDHNRSMSDVMIVKKSTSNIELRTDRNFLGYNIYRNDELQNNTPFSAKEYHDLNLPIGMYEYNITAVYTNGASDPLEALLTVEIIDVDPLSLPFLEEWNSLGLSENLWIPDPIVYSNWFVSSMYGNPGACLAYLWSSQLDYSETFYSHELDGTALSSIEISYDISLNSAAEYTLEEMDIEIFDGSNWNLVANHNNTNGSFNWISENVDISEYAANSIFMIRFVAHGEDAYTINSWKIDNIFIRSPYEAPNNLGIDNQTCFFTWDSPENSDVTGYNVYLDGTLISNTTETEFQYENLNLNQTYIAGVSAIYNEDVSNIVEIDFTYLETSTEHNNIPKNELLGNYPNPFNPTTTISFNLSDKEAKLEIYNLKGQKVRDFSISNAQTSITWNGKDNNDKTVNSGVYFYKLSIDNFSKTKKMILVK